MKLYTLILYISLLVTLISCSWGSSYSSITPQSSYQSPTETQSRTEIPVVTEYASENCDIKGNVSFTSWEKIYHIPGCDNYHDTVIDTNYWERWFCSESEARAAWWRKARNCN